MIRSIDSMKSQKDCINGQPSDIYIQNLVDFFSKSFNITHVALSTPLDSNVDFVANGNNPKPRTIEGFTQFWCDTIHNKNLNVIFRGTFGNIENIYNFPFKVFTAQQIYDKITNYITSNPSFFKDGDIFAPIPEATQHAFDGYFFIDLVNGSQTYADFFNGLHDVASAAFKKIGKNVSVGLTTNNWSEINSGWIPQSLFDKAGQIVYDHYGVTHTPSEMDQNARDTYASRGKLPIFHQEWSNYWDVNNDDSDMYAVFEKLFSEGIYTGFNSWSGWTGAVESTIAENNGVFSLTPKGVALQKFFATIAGATSTPTPTPTPQPTPTPATSDGYTGEYFDNQTLSGQPRLIRTDTDINFDWGANSPDISIPADHFSARWTKTANFVEGEYAFTMTVDDGGRLYIDDQVVLDGWKDQAATLYTTTQTLTKGTHTIMMEYYENAGGAVAKLTYKLLSPTPTPQPIAKLPIFHITGDIVSDGNTITIKPL